MNLVQELGKGHSKALTIRIVAWVGSSKARFVRLVEVYLAGPYRITQRAAWVLSYCAIRNPELVTPHLGKLLRFASRPGVHDAVKRNTVRLLQFIEVPSRCRGQAADLCARFLADSGQPIAVRCFSMTVLANMARDYPDLGRELRLIIEEQMPYYGPALRNRAQRVLKKLTP
jgi:hypothetical protein